MAEQMAAAASHGQMETEVIETTTATFRADVLEPSLRQPVLVDFWAPWCAPCRQIAPVLERLAKAAAGKIKLVKMNIEEYPEIADQLGVKSIPAVIAFQRGRPVDGFVGALPESQIKGFVERLAGPLEDAEDDFLVAEAMLGDGDVAGAEAILLGACRTGAARTQEPSPNWFGFIWTPTVRNRRARCSTLCPPQRPRIHWWPRRRLRLKTPRRPPASARSTN